MDVEIFLLPPVRTRLDMLERDISDCLERIQDAIVGRCVWAWSDITGK